MDSAGVDIEVFSSSLCKRCQKAGRLVAQLLQQPGFEALTWREVDVVEEIDHAVALGIVATPAIAIGGVVVFTRLPSEQQLRHAINEQLGGRVGDGR